MVDRGWERRKHLNGAGCQQGLTGSGGRHLGSSHLRGGNHRHCFPDARLLAGVWMLLRRLECGLRRQHVRHQDWLRRRYVLLARVSSRCRLLLRLLRLLDQHGAGRLRRVRARRRVTRGIRSAGTSRRERLGSRV